MKKIIGILAIQGDFQAHKVMISKIGIENREIRKSGDLEGITHLIIPGGETTTFRKVSTQNGLWDGIGSFEGPIMGTCMGSIIMSARSDEPSGGTLGLIDMKIKRNAYGRQINSFVDKGKIAFSEKPFEMIFIRAPRIISYGPDVEPVAWLGDEVTGVRRGNRLAVTFHPELSGSIEVHKYFVGLN